MSFLYEFFQGFLSRVFQYFKLRNQIEDSKLRVYIKSNAGYMLSELEPKWSVKNVKKLIAPRLGFNPDELKIIFAGKELSDETIIDDCDLGQRTVLHAVRRRRPQQQAEHLQLRTSESLKAPSNKPLCAPLDDFEEREGHCSSSENSNEKHKAHFYVYCAKCKKLCRGKLRVRCALCKTGAFTVLEDPKCWQDVLKPQRISGNCENCAAAGEENEKIYAEFYFKCAEHVNAFDGGDCDGDDDIDGDYAAPLDLIKFNFGGLQCLACTVVEELIACFPCASRHVTCLDCFVQYCRSRLSERRFILHAAIGYTLPCPIGCRDSFIETLHHFKLMPEAEYERYLQFATEEFVLQSGGFLCPQPGCGMGLLIDQECQHVGGDCICCENCRKEFRRAECSTIEQCSNISCDSGCGGSGNFWLEINPILDADLERNIASDLTIKASTKPCPKCRTPTEHAGGCMHMTCTRSGCGFNWCWICRTEWTRYCQFNHWFENF